MSFVGVSQDPGSSNPDPRRSESDARERIPEQPARPESRGRTANMLPGRERRRFGLERLLVRLVATCGIVAIGVALGAILVSSKVQGWITGLVVALVSVVLAAVLWSSKQV
jgi:hypothetical protein